MDDIEAAWIKYFNKLDEETAGDLAESFEYSLLMQGFYAGYKAAKGEKQ